VHGSYAGVCYYVTMSLLEFLLLAGGIAYYSGVIIVKVVGFLWGLTNVLDVPPLDGPVVSEFRFGGIASIESVGSRVRSLLRLR
jgi:hypothetical protein